MTNGMMYGDAVSNHVIEIDKILKSWGHETDIFSGYIAPEMTKRVRPDHEYLSYVNNPNVWLIFHYSVYNPNISLFQRTKGKRILIYHNITPPHFFKGWDEKIYFECDLGYRALSHLSECDFAWGDSEFNRQALLEAGFESSKTGVLPIILSDTYYESLSHNDDLDTKLQYSQQTIWLAVGRVVPNKGLDDIIRLFYVYNRAINAQSHLYIVGSRYISTFNAALDKLVTELNLQNDVTFTGRVTDSELITYYQNADMYVTASHHEGFCIPLIESMYFGVPILARKNTAIPETLGGAGILFTDLGYHVVAEMAHLLVTDIELRQHVIQTQKNRLKDFSFSNAESILRDVLEKLVSA